MLPILRRIATQPIQTRSFSVVKEGNKIISFVTDAEGNFDYFKKCIALDDVVNYDEENGVLNWNQETLAKDHGYFVYGGDVGDKWRQSIRLCRTLLEFKCRYPHRVTFLLGNRDIKKMYLGWEIHNYMSPDLSQPYLFDWMNKDVSESYKEYIQQIAAKTTCEEGISEEIVKAYNLPIERIKWIYKDVLGSPREFEFRRQELGLILGHAISDEEVIKSLLRSILPHGIFYEYLANAQLGVIIDNNLFVHGGILMKNGMNTCLGQVPSLPLSQPTPQTWIEALNKWARQELTEWLSDLSNNNTPTGGSNLLLYGTNQYPSSVVKCRHTNKDGRPICIPSEAVRWLRKGGINRIIVGHTPQGICPTVVKQEGVEVIMADTSYSDRTAPDLRGDIYASVSICGDAAHIRGTVKNQYNYDFYTYAPKLEKDSPSFGSVEKDSSIASSAPLSTESDSIKIYDNKYVRVKELKDKQQQYLSTKNEIENWEIDNDSVDPFVGWGLRDDGWVKFPIKDDKYVVSYHSSQNGMLLVNDEVLTRREIVKIGLELLK